jgi:hypothetical protein
MCFSLSQVAVALSLKSLCIERSMQISFVQTMEHCKLEPETTVLLRSADRLHLNHHWIQIHLPLNKKSACKQSQELEK